MTGLCLPNSDIDFVIRFPKKKKDATKNKKGEDTIIRVNTRRHERFTEGQVITVWTGGDLIGEIATTDPQ